MVPVLTSMFAGVCIGFLALVLISRRLALASGLTGLGRILLSVGLGMGVIAVSIKVLLIGLLIKVTQDYHPVSRPAGVSVQPNPSASSLESPFTGPWRALPTVAAAPERETFRPEVVRLGQRLFDEPGLSINGKVACSSCHKLSDGGDDNSAVSTGINGLRGTRNAPTVWNTAFLSRLFWDGRATSLEDQVKGPLVHPVEMGMPSHAAVEAAVRAIPGYAEEFERVYRTKDAVTIDNIVRAIAGYERTLIAANTKYDRFVRGETDALTPQQIRGMALFAGLGCRTCHRDPTFSAAGKINAAGVYKPFPIFSDNEYVQKYDLLADRGAADAKEPQKAGLWRVPSLRNVVNTAPYFHNGSVTTIEEAIRVMAVTQLRWPVAATSGNENPTIGWNSKSRKLSYYRPKILTQEDIQALAAFLDSLSITTNRTALTE